MKRFLYMLSASLACVTLMFVSCSKNDKLAVEEPISPSEAAKYPYSSLDPEQQKEKLANEANDFLSQIQDLNKEKSLDVFDAFNNLLEMDAPNVGGNSLSSAGDIIKINNFYGKFTWQSSSQTWLEEQSNQLEFNFPVGSSTGKIVVSGVSSGKNYTYEDYYEYYDYNTGQWVDEPESTTFELPKQLSAQLYLGGSEVGSIQVDADIVDAQTAPNSAAVSFNFGSYKYAQSYDKAAGKATAYLMKGNAVLINLAATLNGNIDNLGNSDNFSGNFTLQMTSDLAFTGTVDYANYAKEMNQLDDNYTTDEIYAKGSADAFNKYFDVYLVSVKDKTKIAKLTEKAVLETEYYYGYTYTYWDTIPILNFNDSTAVEANVYFSTGFDMVINNFNKFMQSFQ